MGVFNPTDRHGNPLLDPRSIERPIVHMVRALEEYDRVLRNAACPVSEDYILGPIWLTLAYNLIGLLNGPTGRLDCGPIDSYVREMVKKAGFDRETLLNHGFDFGPDYK